jgi:hypothetical protein
MTIKQLGGVFGRNPTFNDVTIEGQLTFNGDIDIDSDLKVDGDLDVTGTSNLAAIAGTGNVVLGNTITNPASNFANQRGFGWNDSTKVLEISSSVAPLELGRTSGGGDGQLLVFRQATNVAAEIRVEGNAGYFKPYNGGGIDFSATAGAGTSELLDDYEEGVWTPANDSMTVDSGTFAATGTYVKVGKLVFIDVIQTSGTVSAGSSVGMISGFPFVPARTSTVSYSNGAGTLAGVGITETNSKFYGATAFSSQTALRFSSVYTV